MLFVTNAIRVLTIKNKEKGSQMLELMVRSWIKSSPQFDRCTLIFDNTKMQYSEDRYNVISARPNYSTSDDALVHWATTASTIEKASTAVCTSDRALTESLENAGVFVFRTMKWFKLAAKIMPLDGATSVNSWANKFVNNVK